MATSNTIEEVHELDDCDESYTENTMRTVDFDDNKNPSRKEFKMSIDGLESGNPYSKDDSDNEGTWF